MAFNPLHPRYLGDTVSRAFLQQECGPLPPRQPFEGAGVYAIYYRGKSPLYASIAEQNADGCNVPIYVGKAVPKGSRKGVFVEEPGRVLHKRLTEHAESIVAVERNATPSDPGWLRLEDFFCRFLVVEQVWIPLIESLSITSFKPAWNGLIDGFGHHNQGITRTDQQRSFWDTLHPGREWAFGFRQNELTADAIANVLQRWMLDPTTKMPSRRRTRKEGPVSARELSELEPVQLPVEEVEP